MSRRPGFNDIVNILEARGVLRTILDNAITLPITSTAPHLTLCHISQKLRTIILSNPSYWDTFILSSRDFQSRQNFFDSLSIFARRRGSLPISFVIVTDPTEFARMALNNVPTSDMVYGSGRIGLFNEIIRPYLGRLRFVVFYISRVESSSFLLNIPQGTFQELGASDGEFFTDPNVSQPSSSAQRSPNSTTSNALPGLNLPQCRIFLTDNVRPLDVTFQWTHMTRFDFRDRPICPDDILRLMQRLSHSLREAWFDIKFDARSTQLEWRHRVHRPLVNMSVLTQLYFQLIDSTYYPKFILLFHLPALRHLWVVQTTVSAPFIWDMPSYSSWLSPASHSLETLMLTYNPSHPEPRDFGSPLFESSRRTSSSELENLLRTTPRLIHLVLPTNINVGSPILAGISSGDLLTDVETLKFATEADPNEAFSMVNDRRVLLGPSSRRWASEILALTIYLPATYLPEQALLASTAASLNLPGDCILQFVL